MAVAAAVFLVLVATLPQMALDGAAIAFFLLYLLMTAIRLPALIAGCLKHHARDTDEPVTVIFLVTFSAVVVALASLFVVLNRDRAAAPVELALAFGSVALGWLTIQTMAALHYAHLYWVPRSRQNGPAPDRGLAFPQTEDPGVFDFLYFAFVIGMTAQTSDVVITTTAMRKVNLLHAIVSFFFNTVLVAAAVNAAVSLAA
ncbi:DUF1345 domain-containing protein [Rhizobium sp. TRM95111]|nr:DUF1345 domain-containing protein [Rhizobium alarense]MCF3639755.1 DUF1345 domain-containing protein [Rhizobium alarense]